MGGDAEGGLIFELWLRDSQSNFHQKIAMLYILIYIFFMFFLFFDFSFVTTLPPLLPIQISISLIFYIFSFSIFHLLLRYPRYPLYSQLKFYPRKKVYHLSCGCVTPNLIFTRKLPCYIS